MGTSAGISRVLTRHLGRSGGGGYGLGGQGKRISPLLGEAE